MTITVKGKALNTPDIMGVSALSKTKVAGKVGRPKRLNSKPKGKVGKLMNLATEYSPPTSGSVSYKKAHLKSLIPGVVPNKIRPGGQCEYTEEQLQEVRDNLPVVEIEGRDRVADYVQREKQVAQTELLMLKGVSHQNTLAEILGVTRQHVQGLQQAVRARWEMAGGPRNAHLVKGEALNKLSMIENAYWTLYQQGTTTPRIKVAVLSNLVTVIDRKLLINGLSPRVLEDTAVEAASETAFENQSPAEAGLSIQQSLIEATDAAVKLIAEANIIYADDDK